MQNKTSKLEAMAAKLGLKVNRDKSNIMRINEENGERIKLETGELDDVAEFTYLGSKITFSGGTDEDIKTRIKRTWQLNVLGCHSCSI
ncbi:Hypothetical predicted protein [Octopus vulgaris]|uniref:Reverse transcriptase domain-containing protein n=1 Tax=Octopus vulgaris TaxID=6645 RepID=A0AA36BVB8_OCTVU|nr:Hypothetical predicted protein [Octopus vulgaris]